MKAIDLSVYQTVSSWQKVYEDGIRFAVIKASQGATLGGQGAPFADPALQSHADGAAAAGVPFGFYHFFCAADRAGAVSEAKFFLDTIHPWQPYVRHVFLDCEVYGNQNLLRQTRAQLSASCRAFLETVGAAGYTAGLYTNPDHIAHRLDMNELAYPLWIAKWSGEKPQTARMLLWQYGPGTVEGIRGAVDLNECYLDEGTLAVQRLFALGYLRSPEYWIGMLQKVQYLALLLVRLAEAFGRAAAPKKSAREGLAALSEAGLVLTPEYWEAQLERVRFLPELFQNLGGFTLRQQTKKE